MSSSPNQKTALLSFSNSPLHPRSLRAIGIDSGRCPASRRGPASEQDFRPPQRQQVGDLLSNRDLGFLPGDIADKLDPYMQPLSDNLTVIRHQCGEET